MDLQALKAAIAEIEVAEAELKAAQLKYDAAAAKVRTFAGGGPGEEDPGRP